MHIHSDIKLIKESDFINFLTEIDSDFTPPLSKKINFQDYYNKIINNAKSLFIIDKNELIALVIYYDNLDEAQVTLLAIKKVYRGKKISHKLFSKLFSIVHKPIRIITWVENEISNNLYIKLGFIEKNRSTNIYGIDEVLMVRK
ncbi:GNAT family N-acetyltransferase [Yersinia enterocolitica]